MKKKLLITMGALSLSCTAAAPAFANDFLDVLKAYVGTSVPMASNKPAGNQALITANFTTRESQLQNDISAGVTTGQITPAEETDLRADLNRISGLKAQYLADGTYSDAEVQSMLNELMNFSTKLQTSLTNSTTTATGAQYGNAYFNNYIGRNGRTRTGSPEQQAMLKANLQTRNAQLDGSIDQGVRSGELTWNEARSLRDQLQAIANKQTRFTANNRISWRESQELVDDYNKLDSNIKVASTNSTRSGGWQYKGGTAWNNDRDDRDRHDDRYGNNNGHGNAYGHYKHKKKHWND